MSNTLAINGGTPVRTDPWPPMFPGGTAYGEEEKQAAIAVIDAQSPFRYYGTNPLKQVDQLEKEYREFLGVEHALAVGSGSAALIVALAALGVGPGTEVIVPGFLWVSDVNAIVLLRGVPVPAEVDDTLNLDARDLERRITPRTKAIIAIHMAGTARRHAHDSRSGEPAPSASAGGLFPGRGRVDRRAIRWLDRRHLHRQPAVQQELHHRRRRANRHRRQRPLPQVYLLSRPRL
ncbi:MAG: aminotransferase class I/II-fold pyridoxal phosphate-dependent enzyme [Armatimonadetes bacterium]|nr:aminotransferase class I/II-fold pyridoxal phosphate-dependent enzyme [Armatimonadota bacterium]